MHEEVKEFLPVCHLPCLVGFVLKSFVLENVRLQIRERISSIQQIQGMALHPGITQVIKYGTSQDMQ